MALELRADTYDECRKMLTKDDTPDFQVFRFVRRGEKIFVGDGDTPHILIDNELVHKKDVKDPIEDAGYMAITNGEMVVSGISDTIPYVSTSEQRRHTIDLLSSLLSVHHITVRNRS